MSTVDIEVHYSISQNVGNTFFVKPESIFSPIFLYTGPFIEEVRTSKKTYHSMVKFTDEIFKLIHNTAYKILIVLEVEDGSVRHKIWKSFINMNYPKMDYLEQNCGYVYTQQEHVVHITFPAVPF